MEEETNAKSAKGGKSKLKEKAPKKKAVVEIDDPKAKFDAYIKSVKVRDSKKDKWCDPVETIWAAYALLASYEEKLAF